MADEAGTNSYFISDPRSDQNYLWSNRAALSKAKLYDQGVKSSGHKQYWDREKTEYQQDNC